jgi:integral membrane sensor domain MASE1
MAGRVPQLAGWLRGRVRRNGHRDGDLAASVAGIGVLAGAYYGAAKLGLSFAFETPSVTAIWPPTGLALAALVLGGYRFWPGVAIGALLANSWTGIPLVATIGITCGNTLEALAGAYLLRRVASFSATLERVRDVLALAIFAAVVSTRSARRSGSPAWS